MAWIFWFFFLFAFLIILILWPDDDGPGVIHRPHDPDLIDSFFGPDADIGPDWDLLRWSRERGFYFLPQEDYDDDDNNT